jgi:hypothetical protein
MGVGWLSCEPLANRFALTVDIRVWGEGRDGWMGVGWLSCEALANRFAPTVTNDAMVIMVWEGLGGGEGSLRRLPIRWRFQSRIS